MERLTDSARSLDEILVSNEFLRQNLHSSNATLQSLRIASSSRAVRCTPRVHCISERTRHGHRSYLRRNLLLELQRRWFDRVDR